MAGLCEIGGGWLVWQWIREDRPWSWGLLGGLVLCFMVWSLRCNPLTSVASMRPGGFFIVLSLLWGWIFDGNRPDKFDVIGATVSLVGVSIIMYGPR